MAKYRHVQTKGAFMGMSKEKFPHMLRAITTKNRGVLQYQSTLLMGFTE